MATDHNFKVKNGLNVEDGFLLIGKEAFSTSDGYMGIKTSNMSGINDYMMISGTSDNNTYISTKNEASVIIRGGGNASAHQLEISSSNAQFHGNLQIDGNLTVNGSSASSFYALTLSRSGSGTATPDIWGTNGTFVIGTSSTDEVLGMSGTAATFYGNLSVSGNLTVSGTQTTLNTTTLQVQDKNIVLNYGSGDTSSSADGAGITIQDAVNSSTDATLTWDATNDEWDFSHGVNITGGLLTSSAVAFGNSTVDPDAYGSYAGGFGNIADGGGWNARGLFIHGGGTGDAAAIAHNGSSLYFGIQNGSAANSMATWLTVNTSRVATFEAQVNVSGHGNSSQWNTAYGWGDHATAGYLETNDNITVGTITSGAITSSGKISASSDLETATRLAFTNNIANGWSAPIIFRESSHLALSDYSGVKLGGYNGTAYGPRFHVNGNGDVDILEGALQMGTTTVIDSSRNLTNIATISSGAITVDPSGLFGTGITINAGGNNTGSSNAKQLVLSYGGSSNIDYAHSIRTRHDSASVEDNTIEFWMWNQAQDASSTIGTLRALVLDADHGLDLKTGGYQVGGTTVIDSNRNLANIGTVSSGGISTNSNFLMTAGFSIYLGTTSRFSSDNNGGFGINYGTTGGTTTASLSIYNNTTATIELNRDGTISSGAITSTGTSSFGNFRLTDSSKMGFGEAPAGASVSHTAANKEGIFWHSNTNDYYIARTDGAWSSPNYQQLRLDWDTGIELNGGSAYGKSGVTVTESDLIISNNSSDPTLKFTTTSNSADPVLQMNGQAGIGSEGFEIWYDNSVGDVHLHTTYPDSDAAIRFHTGTAGSKATSNERFTITGDGHVLLTGDNNTYSPYMSRTNSNSLNAGYNWDTDSADFWINYRGYQDGTTRFRDFRVGDGKNVGLIFVDGSEREVDFQNGTDILVGGTTIIDSSRNLQNIATINAQAINTTANIDAGGRIKATNWIELESAGAAVTTEEAGIRIDHSDSPLWYIYKDNANDAALHIQSAGASGEGDGTPRVRFSRTARETFFGGNVGINRYSITSGYQLDVYGSARITGTTSLGGKLEVHRENLNVGAPNTANHDTGTRISFYDDSATAWYAMGIESNTLWFNSDENYKWYQDAALRMSLVGDYLTVNGNFNAVGNIQLDSHKFVDQAEYSGTSIFSQSGDWYTLAGISETTTPAYFALKFGAHSTMTFVVTTGYGGSNVATIMVLGSTWTQNGGYPGASELRIVKETSSAAYYVQMRLTYSNSTPTAFSLYARTWGATPSSGTPSFVSSLAAYSAAHTAISHVYTNYTGSGSSSAYYNTNGSNSTPSYSFGDDTNTGMYRDVADSIGFATDGTQRATISNGGLDIKSGSLKMNGTSVIDSSRNLTNIGTISSGAITSTGTSSFGNFQLTDSSKMGFGQATAGGSVSHTASSREGISWHSNKNDYGIFRSSGAWSSPNYSQLELDWDTGITLNGGSQYGKSGVDIIGGSSLKMGGTTVIDSSRVVQNVTLGHSTTGALFEVDDWIWDSGSRRRFYFENTGRTYFGSGGGYIFRDSGDTGRATISNDGGLNLLSGGDGLVASTVALAVSGTTVIDSSRNVFGVNGSFTGYAAIGSRVGTISPGLSVAGATNGVPFLAKSGSYSTVFSVLPWSDAITYLASGTYYQGGGWVHASPNDYECLLGISGDTGGRWYVTSNGVGGSWNHVQNVQLWNNSGVWTSAVDTGGKIAAGNSSTSLGYYVGTTQVIEGSTRNLVNIGTITAGLTKLTPSGYSSPQGHAALNIGRAGSGETRAIDVWGSWSNGESKSITFNHGTSSTNIVGQINVAHKPTTNTAGSSIRWGKLYHGTDSSTYTMELHSESTTLANLYINSGMVQIGHDDTYSNYGVIGFGGRGNGANRIFGHNGSSDGLFLASATGQGIYMRPNGGTASKLIVASDGEVQVAQGDIRLNDDGSYGTAYGAVGFGGVANGANRIFASNTTHDGIYLASATGRHIHFRTNGSGSNTFRMTASGEFQVGSTTVIDSSRQLRNVTAHASEAEYGQSMVGNFGQWLAHSQYASSGFNAAVDYWGWNFVQGNTNAPHTGSDQWYRNRVSLGDAYGHGTSSGDYWLEMAYPRTTSQSGSMYIRNCESGTVGTWYEVGANIRGSQAVAGNIVAGGNITAYSDERLKENIETLDGSKVLQMRGVSFTKDGKAGSGVVAQELEKIAPELVSDGEYKSVAYGNLTGYLIEAIKEQQEKIEKLEELVQKLISEK